MISEVFTCDVCGARKTHSSGSWYLGFEAYQSTAGKIVPSVILSGWSEEEAMSEEVAHLCGEKCASVFLSSKLSEMVSKKRRENNDAEEIA